MRRIAAIVVATGLSVCVADAARAAEPFAKVGTYAMQFVHLPLGVRNIGMGATGTADASGFGTGYFNPAGVAFADATTFVGSYEDENYGSLEMHLADFVISSPIPFHVDEASKWRLAGSVGFTRLDFPRQTQRTIFLPGGTGTTFDPDDWMVSAIGAASWSRGIATLSGGVAGKYLYSDLASNHADAWALDLGAVAAFPLNIDGGTLQPRLGYALLNLDTGASYDGWESEIPNEQRGGFGFDFMAPPAQILGRLTPWASLSFDYDRIDREADSDRKYSAGAEATVAGLIHARYGTIDDDFDTYGFGLGWDFGNVLFRVDYAHQEQQSDFFVEVDRDTFGALMGVRW